MCNVIIRGGILSNSKYATFKSQSHVYNGEGDQEP